MKKFLFFITTITVVMSISVISFASESLSDVNKTKYEEVVNELINLGVVTGYPDGTYKPDKTVSRAEMAKLLVVACDLESEIDAENEKTKFLDVDKNHWAFNYIDVASKYGYIEGYPQGVFLPDDEVSYVEAITMVVRALGYGNVVDPNGTWPQNYINKAKSLKILTNLEYDENTADATRGEIAILVWNMLSVTKSYYLVGTLDEIYEDKFGEYAVKISDEDYTFKVSDNKNVDIEKYKDGVIFYLLKKDLKEENVKFESGVTIDELFDDSIMNDYVEEVDDSNVAFSNMGKENFKQSFKDRFDDYVFVKVIVNVDEKCVDYIEMPKMVSDVSAADFEKADRLFVDSRGEVAYIISGLEER